MPSSPVLLHIYCTCFSTLWHYHPYILQHFNGNFLLPISDIYSYRDGVIDYQLRILLCFTFCQKLYIGHTSNSLRVYVFARIDILLSAYGKPFSLYDCSSLNSSTDKYFLNVVKSTMEVPGECSRFLTSGLSQPSIKSVRKTLQYVYSADHKHHINILLTQLLVGSLCLPI